MKVSIFLIVLWQSLIWGILGALFWGLKMGPNINLDFIHIHSIFQYTQEYNECSHKINLVSFQQKKYCRLYLKKRELVIENALK
jgi:hypothetical protein